MADVVVHGPVAWNLVVDLDVLPAPVPHMQFAVAHREVIGGTSAGKAVHLHDRGVDVELHTVLGAGSAATRSVEMALGRAGVPYIATYVDGPTERHLNLMDASGGRVSLYLDVPDHPDVCAPRELARLLEACSKARAVVLDLSQPSREVIDAVATLGVPIWADVHDYDGSSDFHAPFLRAASFVFMNGDKIDNPQDFLGSCVDRGARVAVCTLGADGAVAMDAQHSVFRVPAKPVASVVDSNGAGDAFMAGFLAAHLDEADVATALEIGAEQAARALCSVQLSPLFEQHGETLGDPS